MLVTLLIAVLIFVVVRWLLGFVDPVAEYADVIAFIAAVLYFIVRL